jgi:hypothetical protein
MTMKKLKMPHVHAGLPRRSEVESITYGMEMVLAHAITDAHHRQQQQPRLADDRHEAKPDRTASRQSACAWHADRAPSRWPAGRTRRRR